MVNEAEKFAEDDREKRRTIDIKNMAEALCSEAEKELNLLTNEFPADKKESTVTLIQEIRDQIKNATDTNILEIKVEELKSIIKEIIDTKLNNQSDSDSMSDLNDL